MKKDIIEDLIDFFEQEKLEVQHGSQFTEEELDTIIEALVNLDNTIGK